MNRSMRRNAIKIPDTNKVKVSAVMQLEIYEKVKDNVRKQLMSECYVKAVDDLLPIICICLRDKFGFGKKRINSLVDHANKKIEDIDLGYINFDDVREWYNKELQKGVN